MIVFMQITVFSSFSIFTSAIRRSMICVTYGSMTSCGVMGTRWIISRIVFRRRWTHEVLMKTGAPSRILKKTGRSLDKVVGNRVPVHKKSILSLSSIAWLSLILGSRPRSPSFAAKASILSAMLSVDVKQTSVVIV